MTEDSSPAPSTFSLPDTGDAVPWLNLAGYPDRSQEFTFSLLSDRTGLSRTGVFEHAVALTNLFRPDFTVQVGDTIEGYVEDLETIRAQWEEFDQITDALDGPLFRVPGNHDVSNLTMREEWLRRFGALHYSFTYRDCLFVVLDTQDPPQDLSELGGGGVDIDELYRSMIDGLSKDPQAALDAADPEAFDGRQPANLSDAQVAAATQAISEHPDARWTFVFMHMPIWQDRDNPAYVALRGALGDRDFTMFAGHIHNYHRDVIDGRDHIRLGPSGGVWVYPGEEGNFDHITLVTMTDGGPRIANVLLDGVMPAEGGARQAKGIFDGPLRFDVEGGLRG